MTYFFDNNLSQVLVVILRALEADVLHLRDEFPPNTLDEDWIPTAGERGWMVVTADEGLYRNRLQREALRQNHVSVLFLPDGFLKKGRWEQAAWIVARWPKIDAQVQALVRPCLVRVTDNGKVEPRA